jgi:hypothetical protein
MKADPVALQVILLSPTEQVPLKDGDRIQSPKYPVSNKRHIIVQTVDSYINKLSSQTCRSEPKFPFERCSVQIAKKDIVHQD